MFPKKPDCGTIECCSRSRDGKVKKYTNKGIIDLLDASLQCFLYMYKQESTVTTLFVYNETMLPRQKCCFRAVVMHHPALIGTLTRAAAGRCSMRLGCYYPRWCIGS